MSEQSISLYELLNLSIGAPNTGAVNFSALHELLHAVLGQLGLRETKVQWTGGAAPGPGCTEYQEPQLQGSVAGQESRTQRGITGQEQEETPGVELLDWAPFTGTTGDDEERLRYRVQSCEDGVSKVMKLVKQLHTQRGRLKHEEVQEQRHHLQKEGKEQQHQQEGGKEQRHPQEGKEQQHQQEGRKEQRHDPQEETFGGETDSAVEKFSRRMNALEETVRSLSDAVQKYPDAEELNQCITWDTMQSALLSEREHLQQELVNSGVVDASTPFSSSFTAVTPDPCNPSEPSSPNAALTSDPRHPSEPSSPNAAHAAFGAAPAAPAGPATPAGPAAPAPGAPAAPAGPAAPAAPAGPGAAPAGPGAAPAGPAAPAAPAGPAPHQAADTPPAVPAPPQQTPPKAGQTAGGAAPTRKGSGSQRYPETVEALRNIGKLKERHGKLEARLAALEEGKADQSQLEKLRELITNKGSRDVYNTLADQLNQQRALIDSLMGDREKNVELVNDVQKSILHLQAECEKLHDTTRCLHEDNRQKQSHIEELYKTTEELEVKKADKQMVETEIKADKSALDSKVSRLQFDSVTEQINSMFHELLNKVTGQEQDWHKVIDRLSTEMECKLNRIELDSVKKQLENRWKNIHEKLQAQGAPEHEDAAGIRKQLVDRFHCLSCDRPVVKHTPGPHLVTLPSTPGFPSHKSIRPFTVYALEQFRQHYRSLTPGTNRHNYEAASSVRRRERLQKSHAAMCRQMESVQKQLRHSDRADGSLDASSDYITQNAAGAQQ
ncbi:glutamine-rich protein 2 isoform X3 [Scomber scombrus]|uniref:Glutamine-rich protein 2 isoform X3 n=1 Tax=Scomber scombrus TaxID=13677 RepID=A0AAV1Q8A8_SCOSC